jgi:substrate import-associated zinc metallohydrolase lipoprotein
LLFLFAGFFMNACSEDELSSQSVIMDSNTELNAFDIWLEKHYRIPYNVKLKYRLDDTETNISYNLSPVVYEKGVAFAKILLHAWFGTYNEIKGEDFTKTYIPKDIVLVGSGMYSASSTTVGTASGSVKITFADLNDRINLNNLSVSSLIGGLDTTGTGNKNGAVLLTAIHEFTHILQQTKPYPEEFSLVSDNDYAGGDWDKVFTTYMQGWQKGFVTKYAGESPNEDMAEMVAIYVVSGAKVWDAVLRRADLEVPATVAADSDTRPSVKLVKKMTILRKYLKDSWAIDLDEMHTVFTRRVNELPSMDLTTLD